MTQLTISNIKVDVIRKKIKNMNLSVYPSTGRVRLAAPLQIKDDTIRQFVVSKLDWIRRHQRKFENQERIPTRKYKDGESHYFQGRKYLLRINKTGGKERVVLRNKTYLDMYIQSNSSLEYKKNLLNKWYRAELEKILPDMIAHWEKKIDVKINFWGIKKMKTKWGSCNIEKKRIWLNLELAKKPVQFLEYILVHELVHLLERRHNVKFKTHMNHYLPNWKYLNDELNRLSLAQGDWSY